MIDVLDKERQGLDPKLREIVDRAKEDQKDFLVCAMCSHVIASKSDRMEVRGSHDHWFTNPVGLKFHVGCFTAALGCAISGDRIAADTWFPGFRWRLASCESCNVHMGWYFDSQPEQYFYGLILDNIQDA